jgi:hypothetical protein
MQKTAPKVYKGLEFKHAIRTFDVQDETFIGAKFFNAIFDGNLRWRVLSQ